MTPVMLEIFLLCIVLLAARKRRGGSRKRAFNLRRVANTASLALGTLADVTVIVVGSTGSADGQYRAVSLKYVWGLQDPSAAEGPIVVGFAHSDYSVTEIKECLEAQASISQGDKVANERSNRLVRIVGIFRSSTGVDLVLNDGRPIKTRLNWAIQIGDAVNVFAYNQSGASLTTGAILSITGEMWVKDF